jgi:hypothetical protein
VDVYTHSEMLPAHYYPAFKKYPHFAGNYGNAWWKQKEEFEKFNGPILMTTNCVVPPTADYADRLWTTGATGMPGCRHIDGAYGEKKDFSALFLKRSGNAFFADLIRPQAGDILSVQINFAAVRPVDTGDEVKQRGLSRAVGADEGRDLSLFHGNGNIVDGFQPFKG